MTAEFNPEPRDDEPIRADVVECGYCDRTETMAVEEAIDQGWGRTRSFGLCCAECRDHIVSREEFGPSDIEVYGAGSS